ncbi:hypothetical protein CONPUDRAFT_152857 [Coniophora puteana RWD-64-598 SS2]|uniref:Uncharacterized protein n=1 Tax=Coniophora puteana (strain RWD-64-598) TaxID=741705 RepID=A0A5M3MT85_CONPW|nr:uncharacterized protein CONPUDRAFT_152857 [Coniophora puteana RWD-64-598 SS2]EIW81964.1 hypothetical protein CONPUDRAFT_152857 [Coniophora puteana RWD-64-598 SS2]
MSQQGPPHRFDPDDGRVFDTIQALIEDWQDHVPSNQFQQYGPIDRYLNLKFSRADHLVKPQALFRRTLKEHEAILREAVSYDDDDYLVYTEAELLRDIATLGLEGEVDDENPASPARRRSFLEAGDAYNNNPLQHDIDDDGTTDATWKEEPEDVLMEAANVSFDSTSNNPVVTGKEGTKFPDFVVCSFYRPRINVKDKVRVVMEIASAGKDEKETNRTKKLVMQQLLRYMYRLGKEGDRWTVKAVGIAMVGTEVAFYDVGIETWEHYNSSWYSLYGQEFLDRINEATNWTAH